VRSALAGGGGAAAGAPAAVQLPALSRWTEVERKPMSNVRRKTAEHLARAWNAIPHVTQHDVADITALEALRKEYAPQAEKAGGKLTMTAIALKVVAVALKRFPQFNASVDAARNEIVYRKSVHIGVAADTDRGLLVPVVRDVDRKGLIELSVELSQLSEKARAGKLTLDEMQGGGFSISNLGGIGGTAFTPIVNWPEVAILGISRSAHEPHWTGQAFEPRLMLPLSLSYDHRLIDGADAARFLRWVAQAFEQPFVMQL
jgi:pyruvate dehydrogenase E2 component (dihydrolipoamide acetyltransferase)